MAIICNRKGGIGLHIEINGLVRRVKLSHGLNDIDEAMVKAALSKMQPAMVEAFTSKKPDGLPADIEFGAVVPSEPSAKLSVNQKCKLVRHAESLSELRELAEGEERQTVLDAIDKRAAKLEAENEDG